MSEIITDELRKYAKGYETLVNHKLLAIADRIDAEHERQLEVLYRDMSDAEYVKLPKDADGEYIHVGDLMAYEDNTKPMEVVALVPPAVFLTEEGPRYADMCRHYHATTVEDVLREFALTVCKDDALTIRKGVVEEYAKRLTLAEGEDK